MKSGFETKKQGGGHCRWKLSPLGVLMPALMIMFLAGTVFYMSAQAGAVTVHEEDPSALSVRLAGDGDVSGDVTGGYERGPDWMR
ncbi:MAG: hypothetical protein LBS53_13170 [Synergistaceae bacterium]|jgi:hypothetical protein|nr:hypothetical protein [Synergistaceae bacterium]